MIERNEQESMNRQQEQLKQQEQMQQEQLQAQAQKENARMQHEDQLNARDNETKIVIAEMNAQNQLQNQLQDTTQSDKIELDKQKLLLQMQQLDEKMKLLTLY